ncbi:hypothetical protein BURKHO8Y_210621 [Burkholderia sp. 8Y]|nr:hypothetical protein BURKHO8Y_210621 [Burkholderia sp. 8Y]
MALMLLTPEATTLKRCAFDQKQNNLKTTARTAMHDLVVLAILLYICYCVIQEKKVDRAAERHRADPRADYRGHRNYHRPSHNHRNEPR